MENEHISYSHEREAKGKNISVGNDETESNGHRSIVEPSELAETMRSIIMKYKDTNMTMRR